MRTVLVVVVGVVVAVTSAWAVAAVERPHVAAVDLVEVASEVPSPAPTAEPTPSEPEAPATDGTFTLADLAAGRVSAETFNGYWEPLVVAARQAPCPTPTAGGTVVTLHLGATPPAELGAAYVDWAPLLEEASKARLEECAAG